MVIQPWDTAERQNWTARRPRLRHPQRQRPSRAGTSRRARSLHPDDDTLLLHFTRHNPTWKVVKAAPGVTLTVPALPRGAGSPSVIARAPRTGAPGASRPPSSPVGPQSPTIPPLEPSPRTARPSPLDPTAAMPQPRLTSRPAGADAHASWAAPRRPQGPCEDRRRRPRAHRSTSRPRLHSARGLDRAAPSPLGGLRTASAPNSPAQSRTRDLPHSTSGTDHR